MAQSPDDTHWSAPLMADVVYWTKESVRHRESISTTVFPNEQEDRMKTLGVIDVPLTGWAAIWRGAL